MLHLKFSKIKYAMMLLLCYTCIAQHIELRGITVLRSEKQIITQGIVNMTQGVVELLATTPGGKEHESILVLSCNPQLLQTALFLIGLNAGQPGQYQGDTIPVTGDPIYIYVEWTDSKGLHRVRAEELIWDQKRQSSMPATAWRFTGSRFIKSPQGRNIFAANVQGVLIATYYDPDAILNNPLPERIDDTVYYANEKLLPARGTKVQVILSVSPLEPETEPGK